MRSTTTALLATAFWALWAAGALAGEPARGVVVDPVSCADAPAQTYALYLPSSYTPERSWSLLLAFHPAARGRQMVEKYRSAAEQYGYIVAASNNARNGPYEISMAAAQAMSTDVSRRFAIDLRRVYLTGMSGGARVALGIALANDAVAGVIASSGGYPDSRPREKVSFAIFGTAGTEDFNYVEMRQLDRKLASPHVLAVFEGGHTLPPDEVALEAIEWLELQAMQSGRRPPDAALVARWLEKRRRRAEASPGVPETVYLVQAIIRDFNGLADVSAEVARLSALTRQRDARKAIDRERDADEAEMRIVGQLQELEGQLGDGRRREALAMLGARLSALARRAAAVNDAEDRRQARRVLAAMMAGASSRVQDREYLALLEQYRAQSR